MKTKLILSTLIGILLLGCTKQTKLTPDEARQIAEEAQIFSYPMLDHYKTMFAMAMYDKSGAYLAPFNVLMNKSALDGTWKLPPLEQAD